MRLKMNYKRSLTNFLGDSYKENLPEEDMDMFCLLIGAGIAKFTCEIVYSTVKVPRFCENIIRDEAKLRLSLYEKCQELVKGYICEVKNMKDKDFNDWYKKMQRAFHRDKELYTEKCKKEADKVMLVVYEHLMKKI
ncbi:hypothetical protein IJ384_01280 [bacterium]|nr:hypothetical protein [bacterium]